MDTNNGKKEEVSSGKHEGLPFYPLHFMKECMVVLGVLAFILAPAGFFPAGLQSPADPFSTPAHIKPEWYFLAMYQGLKYVPNGDFFLGLTFLNVAAMMQGVVVFALILIPFFDKYEGKRARRRPLFAFLGITAIILSIMLIYPFMILPDQLNKSFFQCCLPKRFLDKYSIQRLGVMG